MATPLLLSLPKKIGRWWSTSLIANWVFIPLSLACLGTQLSTTGYGNIADEHLRHEVQNSGLIKISGFKHPTAALQSPSGDIILSCGHPFGELNCLHRSSISYPLYASVTYFKYRVGSGVLNIILKIEDHSGKILLSREEQQANLIGIGVAARSGTLRSAVLQCFAIGLIVACLRFIFVVHRARKSSFKEVK